ncbi:MAG: HepT-like ribonuclease domain-containing protein [Thermomicrobiales bacterium]
MNELSDQSLRDIRDAALEVASFLGDTSLEDYLGDRGQQLQIERLLEIIGEALSRALKSSPGLRDRLSDPVSVVGMRNRISHGYDAIDNEVIWSSARFDVPLLLQEVEGLLAQRNDPPKRS